MLRAQHVADPTTDGTPSTQINKCVSHPTLPLLVTAHEDKYIRMFDLESGECSKVHVCTAAD
jgi:striatin 1/3/4